MSWLCREKSSVLTDCLDRGDRKGNNGEEGKVGLGLLNSHQSVGDVTLVVVTSRSWIFRSERETNGNTPLPEYGTLKPETSASES